MRSGEGFIIITGHLGNWEYAAGYIATMYRKLYAPVFVVNSKANDALNWMRGERNVVLLETRYSAKASAKVFFRMRDLLKSGEVLFIVADQEALGGEVRGTMFGKEIRIFGGPFILAQKTGRPFLPLYAFRDKKNHIVLNFEEPFNIDEKDVGPGVDRVMKFFEKHIEERPDQYIWSQERW
jgi:lauroyl/myristoyl acyltransferase